MMEIAALAAGGMGSLTSIVSGVMLMDRQMHGPRDYRKEKRAAVTGWSGAAVTVAAIIAYAALKTA